MSITEYIEMSRRFAGGGELFDLDAFLRASVASTESTLLPSLSPESAFTGLVSISNAGFVTSIVRPPATCRPISIKTPSPDGGLFGLRLTGECEVLEIVLSALGVMVVWIQHSAR